MTTSATCPDASAPLAAASPSLISETPVPASAATQGETETSGHVHAAWTVCFECEGTGRTIAFGYSVTCDRCMVGDESAGKHCAWCGEPGRDDDLCSGCYSHDSERSEYADRATWEAEQVRQAEGVDDLALVEIMARLRASLSAEVRL